MTSRERVKRCLNFEKPDRIGFYDVFLEETVRLWRTQGLPSIEGSGEYFDHDFQIIPLDEAGDARKDGSKFVSISVCEPFWHACNDLGFEKVLKMMASGGSRITRVFNRIADDTFRKLSSLRKGLDGFDGAWIQGDLAYDRGLFFSAQTYRKMLWPLHRELCSFFTSKGLDVIFHSHGNMKEIIPLLIDMGVRAVEPLETGSGLDAFELRREYKKDLALFGNIGFDALRTSRDAFAEEVERKISFLKEEGGYIYRMDKDITPDIKFDDYAFALDQVRKYGDYQCQ